MAIKEIPLTELVFDFSLYPRTQVDSQHVTQMCESHKAGVKFPPILADTKSRRVIDGFHRGGMYKRLEIETVPVELKPYRDDAAMLLDAVHLNAGHGRALSPFDRAHVVILAGALGIKDARLATALSVTAEKVDSLRVNKTAASTTGRVAIKRTIQHMAGRKLNKRQVEANRKCGGMKQGFYVNQIINLIESDLLDKTDEELLVRLRRLYELLEGILVA